MTVLSTPRGRNNLFFRLWAGLDGGAWTHHTIRWDDCPRYTPEWAERTRPSMTRQAWAEEYDCDFVLSGDAVFDIEDLAQCKVGHNPSPDGCSRFINAWDIGRRRDHTVGITIGLRDDTWHVIEYDRFLAPYPVIQRRIEDRHRLRQATTVVESNGVGDPVIENLLVRATPYTTTTKTKTQAVQALAMLIEQGRFKHSSEQLDRELSLYSWDDQDLVQDSVIAASIAAITAIPTPLAGIVGRTISEGWGRPETSPPNPDGIEHFRHDPYHDRQNQRRSNGMWGL
jgi:hypothetical protein